MSWDVELSSAESRATGSSDDQEFDDIFPLCILDNSKMKKVLKWSTQEGFYQQLEEMIVELEKHIHKNRSNLDEYT